MTMITCRLADGERFTVSVSKVRSHHQTYLELDKRHGQLSHHFRSGLTGESLLLTWSLMPGFGLLVASDGRWPTGALQDEGGRWVPVFMPLSIIDMQAGRHAIKPFGTSCFLTAEIDTSHVYGNRTAISDWELFEFEAVPGVLPELLADFADQFGAVLHAHHDARALLAALLGLPLPFQPALLSCVLSILKPEILASFVALFVADLRAGTDPVTRDAARLLAAVPTGAWIIQAFEDLHAWRSGSSRAMLTADSRYDFLGLVNTSPEDPTFRLGTRLLEEARRAVTPRRDLALLATARDEGLYLLEWIAHHRRIGVEQFFIYTNDLTDGSDILLRRLAEAGEIVWIDNTGASPARINMQDKAYYHALSLLPELLDYRWCLVVDLDEVVLPAAHVDYRLPPLLAAREREGAVAVAMSWRVFNSNGHLGWAPGLSAERFVETERHPLIKTAFRTGLFSGSSAHHPVRSQDQKIAYMTVDGEAHKSGDLTDHDVNFIARPTVNAMICHYHVRSLEEYVWKFARGENDGNGVLTTKHFRYNNPGIFELFTSRFEAGGPRPVLPLAEDIRRGIRRLSRLPGVVDAMGEIENRFRQQAGEFVEQSARIMKEDDRITQDTRDQWCALVDRWRAARGPV